MKLIQAFIFNLLLTFWSLPDVSSQTWTKDAGLMRSIDSLCQHQMDSGHFPGLAIAIAYGSDEIWTKGFGFADLENHIPVDPKNHLFRIGSISKSITGAAMARLWQEGKINMDTAISSYVPALPADKGALTLRQLAGHLGGIRHYRDLEFMSNIPYRNVTEALEVFIHDTLLCVPGAQFNYTTYGWTLISAVMEGAAQKPFTSIIRDEVNSPLGLDDLRPDVKDSVAWPRVSFYVWEDDDHRIAPEVDLSNKWAGGGFLCSAEDVARFGFAHTHDLYLTPVVFNLFTSSQQTADGKPTNYGMGYGMGEDEKGRKWIGHSGGSVGGTSMLLIYPERDLVVVTLVNMLNAPMQQLAQRIALVMLEKE